eukprot:gi/632949644/ref/XP_007890279.1/ PREDICTED: cardiomyopathy-associated protein 5 [Callorhinchus milii]
MENFEACISEESDKIDPEISFILEEETCEGGVMETQEEEELAESLKNATKDQSVKPKMNYIMSSSSFSMVTVQSEDSGIIWETVSSSRSSTPWASESTVSDVYSVESSVSSPPGKVIFITDELPQSPSENEHQSNKTSRSEKRRSEMADLKPGEKKGARKKHRNNSCAFKSEAGKVESTVILAPAIDKVSKARQLMDKTETNSPFPMEHSPVVSKIAGKSPDMAANRAFKTVGYAERQVEKHAPMHSQGRFDKVAAEQSICRSEQKEQNSILKTQDLNSSFVGVPKEQVEMSSIHKRRDEAEESKHASKPSSQIRINLAPLDEKDSSPSVIITSELVSPVSAPQLAAAYKDSGNFGSSIKTQATNGIIGTSADDLERTKVSSSEIIVSSPPEMFGPDLRSLAADILVSSVQCDDNSCLKKSRIPTESTICEDHEVVGVEIKNSLFRTVGKTSVGGVPLCFSEKQESNANQDETYSRIDSGIRRPKPFATTSSERISPLPHSQRRETCTGKDDFGLAIKEQPTNRAIYTGSESMNRIGNTVSDMSESLSCETLGLDIKNLAHDMIVTPKYKDNSNSEESPIRHESTISEKTEAMDVDLKVSSFKPVGKISPVEVPACFPEKREICLNKDQFYSRTDRADKEQPNLSATISSSFIVPVPVLHLGKTCKDMNKFGSPIKGVAGNGIIYTITDSLERSSATNSEINGSLNPKTLSEYLKNSAADMEVLPPECKNNSSVKINQTVTGSQICEITEGMDENLNHLSFSAPVERYTEVAPSHFSERQEITTNKSHSFLGTNPTHEEATTQKHAESVETSKVVDVDQNGSSFSTADRTTGVIPQSHSETIVNELSNEKDTKSKKDVFNIVAEGYEILNIIVPPKLYSVDQEACSNMQDNLMYLQKNPLIDKNKIEDEFECAGNVNREGNGQQLIPPNMPKHNESEGNANPLTLWKSNPFTVGISDPFSVSHSNPSTIVESNLSSKAGSNPFSVQKSNPSNVGNSNPSHMGKLNPSNVGESNPSNVGESNPSATEVPTSTAKNGSSDDDYFEKYTLLDEQVDLGKTGLKAQEVPVQVEGNPFPQVDNPVNLKSKSISFSDDTETFMFDEYDMSENPRSFVAMEDEFAQTHVPEACDKEGDENKNTADVVSEKPEGSLLFSTDEGVLSRSYYFPVSTKLAELALLEEPPALAFYYKDLYEEAKGRKEKDNGQSDEESNNSDLLFPSQSSDTDDGNGLYFEKYVLKDDVPGSLRELKTEESFSLMEALSQDNVIDVEADTVFSKDTSTFSAIHTDKAELPTQMRVSEETEVLDECAEKCETAKNETSHILSEIQPIQCEDLSEEAIQTMEDKVHDEISKEIVRFEDTASVDVQKSDSSVRDHVDSVQTAIPIDLFQELMKPGGEVGFCEDTVFVDPSVLKPGSFGGDHFDPAHITILSEFEEQEKPPSEAGACERTPYVEGKIQKPVSPVGNRFDSVHTTILSDSFEEPEIPPSEVGFEGVYNMPTSEQVEDIQNYTPSEEIAVCQIKADVMEKDLCVEDVAFVGTHEAEHLPTDVGEETEGELAEEFISSEAQVHQEINDNQSTERTVPMTVTDECQRVDQFISMDQRVSQKVIEGEIALVNQQLQLKSVQTPGNDTEQATYKGDIELLEAQMICIKDNEYLLKEPCPLESKEEEKMTEEAFPQITAYHKIASEPDDYKGIQAPSTNEEIKGESLTDEIAQALESEWDVLEVPIHESPTGITSCEQDSVYISRDVCQFQTEAFTYKEHGFHYRTISESVDDELDALQQQYLLENVQNQMEEGSETYPEGISQDLFAEDVKKGTDEIYLLEDTRIIDINVLAVPDYDLEFADKDLQELPVEERKNTDVQINEKEDTDVLTLEKSPKPMDTFCITCGFPIFAIDKLFGEHQDHEVTMIDAAMLKMKDKLDELATATQERAAKIKELVTELEAVFNAVEENCTKEAKLLEEQHEEVMKLLLAQYTEMSQIMEEEKKVKLEHLYDQMVHYRCSIDSAKEAVEKTKESIQNDDITFLQSFRTINDSVISALEVAISLDPKPTWCSSFEDLTVQSARPGYESQKQLSVPQSPTVLPQEPNSATSTTVTVYWKVGEDDVIDYFQVYSVDESEGSKEHSGGVSDEYRMAVKESYCTLDNLDPSRRYLVWVMAVNFSGCSLPSEKVTVRTVPSAPVLNPEECSVCWDSATIRWSSADLDDVDIFTLEFHRQSDLRRSTFRSVSGIRGCEQTVKLQPQEDFLFYITAVNDIGSSDKSRPALISTKRTRFHLNKETVPPNLQLSEDGTVIHYHEPSVENENQLNEYPPVLGEPLPTSGQHYWETTVDRCQAYRIGVAYPITTRNCTLGQSLASWCMRYYVTPAGHKYEFLHNSAAHEVFITDFVTRVGILLNGDGSQLSFFNAQSGQLLHSFQHRFTDLICPAFTVEKPVFLAVCTGAELPEFAKCS